MRIRNLREGVEIDSLGNQLTPEQAKYFANSKIRDNSNNLLVCYHRTDSEFTTFDKNYFGSGAGTDFGVGFYFSAIDKDWYGDIKKECYLNITNPFYLDVWDNDGIVRFFNLLQLSREDIEYYMETALETVDNIGGAGFVNEFIGQNELTTLCIEKGYDGIVVGDIMDGEIIAFEPEQIKTVTSQHMVESITTCEDSLGNTLTPEQSRYFAHSKVRDTQGRLLVCYHGTNSKFSSFEHTKKGMQLGADLGFWFTTNVNVARRFSQVSGDDDTIEFLKWRDAKEDEFTNRTSDLLTPYIKGLPTDDKNGIIKYVMWFGVDQHLKDKFDLNDIPKDVEDRIESITDEYMTFYHTDTSNLRAEFEKTYTPKSTPTLISAYLNIEKLKILNGGDIGVGWTRFNEISAAEDDGYDGVLIKSGDTGHGIADEYVVFNSNQIKLITNKTPTSSKNLNEKSESVSYETDNLGNELSTEQSKYFKNSKVRDRNGNLLVVHHGTYNSFDSFDAGDIGFHFGTEKAATERKDYYDDVTDREWKVGKYYLNITNFLDMYDIADWDGSNLASHIIESMLLDLSDDEVRYLQQIQMMGGLGMNRSHKPTVLLRKFLTDRGIDGIMYENAYEDSGSISYIAFNPEQIKFITNKTPTSSKNMNEDIWDSSHTTYQPKNDAKFRRLIKKPLNTLTSEDIKYIYTISDCDYMMLYKQYDSISDALSHTNDRMADIYFQECADFFQSLSFPLTVYRAIRNDEFVDGKFKISGKNNSRSWSVDKNIYSDKSSKFHKVTSIVACEVEQSDIDIMHTVSNFIFYSSSRRMGGYGEYEITMKKSFSPSEKNNLRWVKTPTDNKNLIEDTLIAEPNVYADFVNELHSTFNSMSTEQIISFLNIKQRNDLDIESPMFILPNGKFVSVQETLDTNGVDVDELTHQSICECFAWCLMSDLKYDTDAVAEIVDQDWRLEKEFAHLLTELTYKLGWARINCGTKAVDRRFYGVLPNEVSNKQWWSFETWLNWGYDKNKSDVLVFVTDMAIAKKFKMNDSAPIFPEDIIKNIRRFYSSGRFYEGLNEKIEHMTVEEESFDYDNLFVADDVKELKNFMDRTDWEEFRVIDSSRYDGNYYIGEARNYIHSQILKLAVDGGWFPDHNRMSIGTQFRDTDFVVVHRGKDVDGELLGEDGYCYGYVFEDYTILARDNIQNTDIIKKFGKLLKVNEIDDPWFDKESWYDGDESDDIEEKLTESLQRLASNAFITDSPYQIRDLLVNKPKLYRILYDKNIDMYMIGDGEEVIHWDLIKAARKQGYYAEMESFIDELGDLENYVEFGEGGQFLDDEEIESYLIYMVFSPDEDSFYLGEDGYQFKYPLSFGTIYTRDSYLDDCDLYKVVKATNNIGVNEKMENNLLEGIWSLPDTQGKVDTIKNLFANPITSDDVDAVKDILYVVFGSDELFDSLDGEEDIDYRDAIADYIESFLDDYPEKIDPKLERQLNDIIKSYDSFYGSDRFINEGIIHTDENDNVNSLKLAGALTVGDVFYDDRSQHKMKVLSVSEASSWAVLVTVEDLATGATEERRLGIASIVELAGENDIEVEVDDDIEIEWHPIDDYFDRDI